MAGPNHGLTQAICRPKLLSEPNTDLRLLLKSGAPDVRLCLWFLADARRRPGCQTPGRGAKGRICLAGTGGMNSKRRKKIACNARFVSRTPATAAESLGDTPWSDAKIFLPEVQYRCMDMHTVSGLSGVGFGHKGCLKPMFRNHAAHQPHNVWRNLSLLHGFLFICPLTGDRTLRHY